MATSSIFANFDIRDTEKAEAFIRALELSEQDKRNITMILRIVNM